MLWTMFGSQRAFADCEEGLDYSTCCFTRAVIGRVVRSNEGPDASPSQGIALLVERSDDERVSNGDAVLLERTSNPPPPVGMRIIAMPRPTACDDATAETCIPRYYLVRELNGGDVTCTIPPGVRSLRVSEADAIELGFRSDCYKTLKTSLGYEPDEEVCTAGGGAQCGLARRSMGLKSDGDLPSQLAGLVMGGIITLSIGIRMRRRLRGRS